jgi:hypothetical protein
MNVDFTHQIDKKSPFVYVTTSRKGTPCVCRARGEALLAPTVPLCGAERNGRNTRPLPRMGLRKLKVAMV